MFDWSLNMKGSLCTGGRASVGRLLAEAKDYSLVGFVVNGYFRGSLAWPKGLAGEATRFGTGPKTAGGT